jgi:hypothetical protein
MCNVILLRVRMTIVANDSTVNFIIIVQLQMLLSTE